MAPERSRRVLDRRGFRNPPTWEERQSVVALRDGKDCCRRLLFLCERFQISPPDECPITTFSNSNRRNIVAMKATTDKGTCSSRVHLILLTPVDERRCQWWSLTWRVCTQVCYRFITSGDRLDEGLVQALQCLFLNLVNVRIAHIQMILTPR